MNEATYHSRLVKAEKAYAERLKELKDEIDLHIESINTIILENEDFAEDLKDYIKDIT